MKRLTPYLSLYFCLLCLPLHAQPLKIGYSDWIGWVAWEVALIKNWFSEEQLEVEFRWMGYSDSIEAYKKGEVHGVCMTNGDALVTASQGTPTVGILINDYSAGNDKVIASKDIKTFQDLKGERVALELKYVSHLLFLHGLEAHGMSASDVKIYNCPTNRTPEVLTAEAVKAIAAWEPVCSESLEATNGAHVLYTSADAPGLIYDMLFVDPESLRENREAWGKVIKVWYRVLDYIKDENNIDEILYILSSRLKVSVEQCKLFLDGAYLLTLEESAKVWGKRPYLDSIYGSTYQINQFNVQYEAYDKLLDVENYLDSSLMFDYLQNRADKEK